MKHYLMDLVAIVSLLLIVGLVAWHNKYYDVQPCQAASPQVTESSTTPPAPPVEHSGAETTDSQGWSNPLLKADDADGVTQATPETTPETIPETTPQDTRSGASEDAQPGHMSMPGSTSADPPATAPQNTENPQTEANAGAAPEGASTTTQQPAEQGARTPGQPGGEQTE